MSRTYLTKIATSPRLTQSGKQNLAIVQVNYAYTGVMELATGLIDLCAAEGSNPHYSTITPQHTKAFPQYVGSVPVDPIVHGGAGGTSHETLAGLVYQDAGRHADSGDDFCGFTIRFNKKPRAEFSGTSRSLNSGVGFTNGELEECLRVSIMNTLAPVLNTYGWTEFIWVPPRVNPDDAQRQRGGVVAAAGLMAALKRV